MCSTKVLGLCQDNQANFRAVNTWLVGEALALKAHMKTTQTGRLLKSQPQGEITGKFLELAAS